MEVPRNRWTDGGWHEKLPQFLPLARWLGIQSPNPSPDELQVLFEAVKPKVFKESIPRVLEATRMKEDRLKGKLTFMWHKLGLGSPIPPRSLKEGRCDPSSLGGSVAFVLGGTTAWMDARLKRTLMTQHAGAKFERIVMLGSTRVCNASADRRHPYIREVFPEGREPTEFELLKQWVYSTGQVDKQFVFPDCLPSEGPVLPLQKQLELLVSSGEFDQLVGERKVFVAVNGGNALYVPLHVYRVLGLDDIWFSQPASNAVDPVPEYWWPEDQDLMTTPSGIIRLWIELKANGCIDR